MTGDCNTEQTGFGTGRVLLVVAVLVLVIAVGAATVTSVDQVEFDSNSAFLDGEVFLISYTSDFSTDEINVLVEQDRLTQAVTGEVEQDLSLFVDSQETYAEYSIGESGEQDLVNLALVESDLFDTESEAESWGIQHCYDLGQDGNIPMVIQTEPSFIGEQYRVYCARYNGEWGPVGNIETPRDVFETEWVVDADGEDPQTATLSNTDVGEGTTTMIGDHVLVDWAGNVHLGERPPGPADEGAAALYVRTADDWRVISASEYTTWDSFTRNDLPSHYLDWARGDIDADTLQGMIDRRAEEAASVHTDSALAAAETSGDASAGQLRLDMTQELAWPQFTVYVDAVEFVSVSKPVGTPSIVTAAGDRFSEIDSGTVEMTVENAADSDGSFSARVRDCSPGFGFDDTAQTRSVAAGQTVDYRFDVSFQMDADDEVDGSCTLEVANQEGLAETTAVEVTGIPLEACAPGERFDRVDANGMYTIYECDADGMSYSVVEECASDEVADIDGGELQCVEEDDNGEETGIVSRVIGAVTSPVATVSSAASSVLAVPGQFAGAVTDGVAAVLNPFDDLFHTLGVVAALAALVLAFYVAGHPVLAPVVAVTASTLPVSETQAQYVVGAVLGLVGAWLAYDVFSSWVVYVLLVAAAIVYVWLESPLSMVRNLV